MRDGKELDDAVKWFEKNDIPLLGVNKHPTQHRWTTTPKCSAISERRISISAA